MAKSSAKTKFIIIAYEICEVMWLEKLLNELQIAIKSQIKLYWNNETVINISHNIIQHDRTKYVEYVEVNKYLMKEKIKNEIICLTYGEHKNI